MNQEKYTFEDLLEITRRLCSPDGCPWDSAQTHKTLRRFAIEEAYELVDAIETGVPEAIADESGDLLFQVVLNACLAERNGEYTIDDVTDAISKKMLRRHPAVFGLDGPKDWDAIKRVEKQLNSIEDELNDIPDSLPALLRAEKFQKKLSKAGYVAKCDTEDRELKKGKQLFDLVASCRDEGICPELALHRYLNAIKAKEIKKCD